MCKPKTRLLAQEDFKWVIKRLSLVIKSPTFNLRWGRNKLGYPRFSVIVPKKVVAKAVERNLLKRVVREQVRLSQTELGGVDMLFFVVNAGMRKQDWKKVFAAELKRLLSNLKASQP